MKVPGWLWAFSVAVALGACGDSSTAIDYPTPTDSDKEYFLGQCNLQYDYLHPTTSSGCAAAFEDFRYLHRNVYREFPEQYPNFDCIAHVAWRAAEIEHQGRLSRSVMTEEARECAVEGRGVRFYCPWDDEPMTPNTGDSCKKAHCSDGGFGKEFAQCTPFRY